MESANNGFFPLAPTLRCRAPVCRLSWTWTTGRSASRAKIILDSLRVSLSLYIHDRHRAHCHVEPEQPEMVLAAQAPATCTAGNCEPAQLGISGSAWEQKPAFGVLPRVALRGEIPMPTNDVLKVIRRLDFEATNERLDETPVVTEDSVQKKTGDQPEDHEFRPLNEEEKKEFMNSLNANGKKILAGLSGKNLHPFVRSFCGLTKIFNSQSCRPNFSDCLIRSAVNNPQKLPVHGSEPVTSVTKLFQQTAIVS